MEAALFMSRRLTPQRLELRTEHGKAFCEYPAIVAAALEQDLGVAPALSQTLAEFGAQFGAGGGQTLAEFGAERHIQRVDPFTKPLDRL